MERQNFLFYEVLLRRVCFLPPYFVIQQLEPFVRIRSAIFERLLYKEAELPFKLIPLSFFPSSFRFQEYFKIYDTDRKTQGVKAASSI